MKSTPVLLMLTLVGGLGIGVLAGRQWQPAAVDDTPSAAASRPPERERKVLYWYDPMVPQQHFDQPGKSPFMDMELVPRYADEAAEAPDAGSLGIPAAQVQRLGLRTAAVTRITAAAPVEASGVIGFDERAVTVLQSRAAGFVEQAWPLAPGDVVAAGQPLLRLRLPEWGAAQAELLAVRSGGDAALLAAARERLRALGMDAAALAELERSGVPTAVYTVRAPAAGLIESLDARAGMTLGRGATVLRLRGLDPVWLEVAVPQALAGRVRPGADAQTRLDALPGQVLRGRVTAVLPALATESRSLRVRVELPNADGRLRPGQAATVRLTDDRAQTALAVPTEAVIRTGTRTLVMRAQANGGYRPQAVEIGPEVGDLTVITAGLTEGDAVVASGQFLLDSEASLLGIGADAAPGTPHAGHGAPAAEPAANGPTNGAAP
jgi:Cu(I)/Ag(I) efflux system membrane fusion protein